MSVQTVRLHSYHLYPSKSFITIVTLILLSLTIAIFFHLFIDTIDFSLKDGDSIHGFISHYSKINSYEIVESEVVSERFGRLLVPKSIVTIP